MKTKIVCPFFLLTILLLTSISTHATEVRGRIDFRSYNGHFPMARAHVQICHQQAGGCLSYYTGYDGMYYFNAMPGPHAVLVNGRQVFQVVIPNQQYFDLQPLLGN
ncbi:MAG: hypothetical protein KUG60_00970 [Gammaproteobacteria bacterium]|nr:hypothetical protein [Gammaproteobacteria bacterium]